jgi:hypothetical protein
MILGWFPFKMVSVSTVLYPRWPPLLTIEISSNGQNCSMFSHGGHLGYRTALTDTILKGGHTRIISAKFGWDWLSSLRGEDFFICSIRTKFWWNSHWMVLFQNCVRQRRPVSKMAAMTKNRNFFKWPKLLYLGHNFWRGPPKNHFSKVWLRLAQ